MIESLELQLDRHENRLLEIEKNICIIQDNITELSEQLKETQRYLIKLAQAQSEVAKRVTAWPYIHVN